MSNLNDILQNIQNMNKQLKKVGNLSDRIQSLQIKAKTKEEKELYAELSHEFALTMKEAGKGKLRDLSHLMNKLENLANGD